MQNLKTMPMKTQTAFAGRLFCFSVVCLAMGIEAYGAQGVEVVETRLDFEDASVEVDSPTQKASAEAQAIDQEQITQLNRNLKNAITDNKKLKEDLKQLQEQLTTSRGQAEIEHNRANAESLQKGAVAQKAQELEAAVAQLQQQLEETQKNLAQKETVWQEKEKLLEMPPTAPTQEAPSGVNAVVTAEGAPNIMGMISRIDSLHQENEKLKSDAAKVHYNIGNVYFQKGEYEKAGAEYKQSVELMPYDPFAHFNLAFVSGEYLNDPKTALTHYQRYLYLNPQAEDAPLVKEKILSAELQLRSKVESSLDPIRQLEIDQQKEQQQNQKAVQKKEKAMQKAVKTRN